MVRLPQKMREQLAVAKKISVRVHGSEYWVFITRKELRDLIKSHGGAATHGGQIIFNDIGDDGILFVSVVESWRAEQ